MRQKPVRKIKTDLLTIDELAGNVESYKDVDLQANPPHLAFA
jgi:hypothetical protein